MPENDPRLFDLQRSLTASIRAAEAQLHTLQQTLNALKSAVQSLNEGANQTADLPLPKLCEHRKAHRFGKAARIPSDPELEAFIRARIDHMTFMQIEAEVAGAFPKHRRVRKSAIHRWWQTEIGRT